MSDVSEYFLMSRAARGSLHSHGARLAGAMFSLYAASVDTLRLPQFVAWLGRKNRYSKEES